MTELKPGDIVEIDTDRGLAYGQVTHCHIAYPEVVRVFAGLHAERPDDLETLSRGPAGFTALFPLGSAIESGRISARHIGHAEIATGARAFPTFTMPIRGKRGEIVYWWLWDGDSLSFVSELNPEADAWPLREVLTAEKFNRSVSELAV